MVRFLQGQFEPDSDAWPLISRSGSFAEMSAQDHRPSDLYLVELSSAKRLTLGGAFVQLNYVTNAFAHFFADQDRSRAFWAQAETGNQAAIDRFLAKQSLSDTETAILRQLRLSLTTQTQLRADIAMLQDMLPRLLIVTHINARKPDGMPIATRSAFIDMVKEAARAIGVRVYDPTQRMLEMGQPRAIADQSAGLAHYSDHFADAICDDWVDLAIGPAIDDLVAAGDPDAVTNLLAPHMTALTGRTPFWQLRDRLTRLGARGAIVEDVMNAVQTAETAYDPQQSPVHGAYLLGQFETLVQHLQTADPLPDPDQLLTYAKAAPANLAFDILLRGFAADPHSNLIADRLAEILLDAKPNQFNVPSGLRSALSGHITPLNRVKLCLAYDWDLQLVAQDLAPDDATEVVAYIARTQTRRMALTFLQGLQHQGAMPAELSDLLGKWCTCQQINRQQKVLLCIAVLAVDPLNAQARTALRDLRRSIRKDMRAVLAADNHAGLDELAALNALLPDPLPEVDLFRARACFRVGDYSDAIKIGCSAAKALPDNLSVWVLLMRAAHKIGQDALSAGFAKRVIALSNPDTGRFAAEAANRIGADVSANPLSAVLVPHD